jgi:hypothetical protein
MTTSTNHYAMDDDYENENDDDTAHHRMHEVEMNDMNHPTNPTYNTTTIPLDHMDYGASLPSSPEEIRMNNILSSTATSSSYHSATTTTTTPMPQQDHDDDHDDPDLDHAVHSGRNKSILHYDAWCTKQRMWIVSFILCMIMIIGLSIGITNKNKNSNNPSTTSEEPEPRYVDIATLRTYLFDQYNISTNPDTSLSQYHAAKYMAEYDLYNMKLPGYSNGTDYMIDNGIYAYRFIARYVMILNYVSLGGSLIENNNDVVDSNTMSNSTWYNELLFGSELDICDWKGYVIGMTGIEFSGIKCLPYTTSDDIQPQLVPTEFSIGMYGDVFFFFFAFHVMKLEFID